MVKLKCLVLIISLFVLNCNGQKPSTFSQEALEDTFVTLNGDTVTFQQILDEHKGNTLLIDVWASWCKDCIKGLPNIKELQESKENIVFVFLSLDKSLDKWKKGIENYQIKGNHYFMQSGWNGPFGEFLNLDWIPRYLVVDKDQNISIYKETKVNKNLKNSLP